MAIKVADLPLFAFLAGGEGEAGDCGGVAAAGTVGEPISSSTRAGCSAVGFTIGSGGSGLGSSFAKASADAKALADRSEGKGSGGGS